MNDDLKNELSIIPDYDRQIITKSVAERIAAMKGLLQLYIASDMTAEIYQKMYLSSVMAIEKKKDMAAKRQAYENFKCSRGQSYVGILGGNNCYSIIGNSGIGKTSAIERSIELINRNTEEINGAKILNVLVVQTPFDCSVKGLMLEIIRLVDLNLGTTYSQRIRTAMTTDMLVGMVSQICLSHISVLVLDEIQNINGSKNGAYLVKLITQLINSCGIAIVFVGIEEVEEFFQKDMFLARRTIGLRFYPMQMDDEYYRFCEALWSYQYTKEQDEFSEHIAYWLYQHTQGISSITKGLIMEAQQIAIVSSRDKLDITVLEEAYKQRYQMLYQYVAPPTAKLSKPTKSKVKEEIAVQEKCEINDLPYSQIVNEAVGDVVAEIKKYISVLEVAV